MNLKRLISARTLKNTFLAGLAALVASCQMPGPNPNPTPPTPQNELSPNTKILSSNDAAKISSVEDNDLIFSSSPGYSTGDILVSNITTQTPEGLLRKVSSVSGNTVYTTQATLEDAIENHHTLQKEFHKVRKGVNEVQAYQDGFKVFHNFVREGVKDKKTPAERCGIEVKGNKWETMLLQSIKQPNLTEKEMMPKTTD